MVKIYYRYSALDKKHQFFIPEFDAPFYSAWYWFYLGKYYKPVRNVNIYPFSHYDKLPIDKNIKASDAKDAAKMTVRYIYKKINSSKKR